MSKDTPESLGFNKPSKPKQTEKLTVAQRQARMLQALADGISQQDNVADTVYRLFKITPNLNRKDWRELILFLRECGDPCGKLEAFGKWWYREFWIGQKGQAPTADQIRTYLPQALEKYAPAEDDRKKYSKWEAYRKD